MAILGWFLPGHETLIEPLADALIASPRLAFLPDSEVVEWSYRRTKWFYGSYRTRNHLRLD